MNRRNTLKTLAAATGGIAGLSLIEWKWHVVEDYLNPTFFSRKEQEVLTAIADTIIPAGPGKPAVDTGEPKMIGALSTGTEKYLMKLLERCYEKEVQDNVKIQLAAVEASAEGQFDSSFAGCTQAQREELLMARAASEVKEEKDFFDLMKSETIRGFTTTQEVMVDYLEYKIAPGFYNGCAEVKALA